MATVDATDARLSAHEEVCAMRYEQINARLKRLEGILIKTSGALLAGMGGAVFLLITHLK
jgi:hypothetical protein